MSFSSPAIGPDGTVYVSSESSLYALNGIDGTLKWQYQANRFDITSSPTIGADGTIYVNAEYQYQGYLYALYPNSGILKWTLPLVFGLTESPAIGSDGIIYVGT